MNLLDPNCGMDPEQRREILRHTDAGRVQIAREDAEFAEGLPPGWAVDHYMRGPNKGKPCLRKGRPGQPGHEVKPIPEGHEVRDGQLQKTALDMTPEVAALPSPAPTEVPLPVKGSPVPAGLSRAVRARGDRVHALAQETARGVPRDSDLLVYAQRFRSDEAQHLGSASLARTASNQKAYLADAHVAARQAQAYEEEAERRRGATAPTPAEPPHPLAGIPGVAGKIQRLVDWKTQVDQGQGDPDPLGVLTKGPPPGLDMRSFQDDLVRVIARHHLATGTDAPLHEVHAALATKYGLSKHAFLRAVGHIQTSHQPADRPIAWQSWGGPPDSLPARGYDPELVMIGRSGKLIANLSLPNAWDNTDNLRTVAAGGDQTLETPSTRSRRKAPNSPPPAAASTALTDADRTAAQAAGIPESTFATLKSLVQPVQPADLKHPHIALWHGTTNAGAYNIARSGGLVMGPRGRNASVSPEHAAQYPEDTGAEYLVLLRAKTKSLAVDPNDQIGRTVADGLFPRNRFQSSCTVHDAVPVALFEIQGAKDPDGACAALERGDLAGAIHSGVKITLPRDFGRR